jgi:hypothetical protein
MAKVTLFEVQKTANGKADVILLADPDDPIVVVRGGLLPNQADILARRLNSISQSDAQEFKPTRREQKFTIHFEGDFELTSFEDADEFYNIQQIIRDVKDSLEELEPVEGIQDGLKVKVNVKKLYDKQVPNI